MNALLIPAASAGVWVAGGAVVAARAGADQFTPACVRHLPLTVAALLLTIGLLGGPRAR